MKKVLVSLIVLSVGLTSCLKDTTINTDLATRGNSFMIIQSGLEYFSTRAVVAAGAVDPIVTSFTANYANADGKPLASDVTLTFAIDDAKRVAYNTSGAGLQYEALPANCYSFPVTSGVVKAGTNLLTLNITFYPLNIDPAKLYMLPITLTGAGGNLIAANFSTVYFHVIGNPLAGNYNMTGTRTNYTGAVVWTGPPAPVPAGGSVSNVYAGVILALPDNALQVQLDMGNIPEPITGALAQYYVFGTGPGATPFATIDYNNGPNWDLGYSHTDRFILGYVPPTSTQKPQFRLITHYNNGLSNSGSDRIIDQTFVHQ